MYGVPPAPGVYSAPLPGAPADQNDTIQALAREVAALRSDLRRAVPPPAAPKPDAMSHRLGMTNEQYYASIINEGAPVDLKERVPILVGTVSVVELVPRQAKVPRSGDTMIATPVTHHVPVKPGLVGKIFGPRDRRVTQLMNTRTVQGAHVTERSMVLYQPVLGPGRKRAVVVGINYVDSPRAGDRLENGCNDARYMRQWLGKQGFGEIISLVDDDASAVYPSRENIFKALKWLVTNVKAGDNLFFFFSGHGDWKLDFSGDEQDDHDECLVPADYHALRHPADPKAGYIVDDELYQLIVKPLPKGAMLHTVLDACHSGTALDLPYLHNHRGQCVTSGNAVGTHATAYQLEGDVIMLSAAKDTQSTPDRCRFGSVKMGLLTYCFLTVMERLSHPSQLTYEEFLQAIQNELIRAYPPNVLAERAIPILSTSKPYDLDHPIVM